MQRLKLFLFGFLFLSIEVGHSQTTLKNIDSLLTVLQSAKNDTAKVMLYQKIAGHYNVANMDSVKMFIEKGLALSEELDYPFGKMMTLNVLGNFYERKTQYDKALETYRSALDIAKKTNSTKGFAILLNNIAMVQTRQGNYQKALENYFDALRAEEKLGNKNGIAQAYNNIGVVYYYLRNFGKTTHYLTKALEIQEKLGNIEGLQDGYNNVGAIYDYQKKYDKAIASYSKALEISKKLGDIKQGASNMFNIALAYAKKGEYDKAKQYFSKSSKIRDSIKDYNGLASNYIGYGQMLSTQNKFSKSEKYLMDGLGLSKKHGIKNLKREAYKDLAELAAKQDNFKTANEYLHEYIAINDSILNEKSVSAIANLEVKYQTEKKENQILQQRTQLIEKELQVKRKNTLFFGSLGLALLLGLLGYLLFNQQKLKNRQLQKEGELQTALARIETQNQLQEQRLRISRDLHDNIGSQLTFIISSIDNLKYGFREMPGKLKTKLSGISGFTTQTIYELRDTIWAMNKTDIGFEDLQSRITNFIDKAKTASGKTKFEFNVASDVNSEHSFTSVQGMNIYRIIQEAVNNSLKHAEASLISVGISKEKNGFRIVINDNGKGFDPETAEMGNGLNNIKKRARDLGGEIEMVSEKNEGTRVVLDAPL